MKSTVVVEIDSSQQEAAALFADPANNPSWMEDIARYEPLTGKAGTTGSTYRLVPKRGSMVFTATVVAKTLPKELRLRLDGSNVTVDVHGTFSVLAAKRTRLVSEEVFRFHGLWQSIVGLLARPAIRKAHREHIESFKRFAENRAQHM